MEKTEKIQKLRQALELIQDVNEVGVNDFRQDVILGSIEKELAMTIVAMEVMEKYR